VLADFGNGAKDDTQQCRDQYECSGQFFSPCLLPKEKEKEQQRIEPEMAQVIGPEPFPFDLHLRHIRPVGQHNQCSKPGEEEGGQEFSSRFYLLLVFSF